MEFSFAYCFRRVRALRWRILGFCCVRSVLYYLVRFVLIPHTFIFCDQVSLNKVYAPHPFFMYMLLGQFTCRTGSTDAYTQWSL
jgi:hypothetical protein